MAKLKGSKGQENRKTKHILETISEAQCPLFALEDICKAVQTAAVAEETAHDVAMVMREKINGIFTQAEELLPNGHEARGYLKLARERLNDVCSLTRLTLGGSRLDKGEQQIAFGRAMLSAVSAAGRFMELAEYSLGERANGGWLAAMMNVDGIDKRFTRVFTSTGFDRLDLLDQLTPENADKLFAYAEQVVRSQAAARQ